MNAPQETEVLIRAKISADRRTIIVAPGIEVRPEQVDVATEIPRVIGGDYIAVMFFATKEDRDEYAESFRDETGVEVREI